MTRNPKSTKRKLKIVRKPVRELDQRELDEANGGRGTADCTGIRCLAQPTQNHNQVLRQ